MSEMAYIYACINIKKFTAITYEVKEKLLVYIDVNEDTK